MMIRSCSYLCGFISRAAWRRHCPLLHLRPPAPLLTHFFSSSTRHSTKKSAKKVPMDPTSEPFYVIRKGDVIGIYKSLSDCQGQVSNSVCDPSATVYKGYSLRKETEEYLAAHGLRNALYTIDAADARDELFGDLLPCPFQQPDETAKSTLKISQDMESGPSKKQPKVAEKESLPDSHQPDETAKSTLKRSQEMESEPSKKQPKVTKQKSLPDSNLSCILEFDGACKGNPGKSGAGAIIRRLDGSVIAELREGLGVATNNAAEYHALILGLKYAAKKGFKHIRVQGDSKLVCYQVKDLWRAKNDNMADLCKKAKELKKKFISFQLDHVLREFNSDADAQANFAVELPAGEVQELSKSPH